MPWRPGGRFPRGPFPGGRPAPFPRFRRRPHVYWLESARDTAAGTLVNANTVSVYPIVNYTAGGLATDPSDLMEEISIRRIIGRFRFEININPSVTSFIASYFGITVIDIEPSTGNPGETNNAVGVQDARVIQSRRWLYQNAIYWGNRASGGTTTQVPWNISDGMLPQDGRPQIDIQLRGLRLRENQRLFFVSYHEETGASDANLMRQHLWFRALATKRP